MTEKALDAVIRKALLECLPSTWGLPIVLGYQSTPQGRVDGIYFNRLHDSERGWVEYKYSLDTMETSQMTESQFQFQALVKNNPKDKNQMTALDAVTAVRLVISSLRFIAILQKAGVGVQRPSNIVQPPLVNEQGNYEIVPSFTVVFSHVVSSIDTPYFVDGFEVQVERT